MIIRFTFCVLLVGALVSVSLGVEPIPSIEVLGYGEYRVYKGMPSSSDKSPSGRTWNALPEIVTTNIDTIEARLGNNFGFHYILKGSPTGTPVQIKTVIHFPEQGITNAKGDQFKSSEYVVTRTIGGQYFVGYGFDNAWELVGGEWVIELWRDDILLAQKIFRVFLPQERLLED